MSKRERAEEYVYIKKDKKGKTERERIRKTKGREIVEYISLRATKKREVREKREKFRMSRREEIKRIF